MHLVGWSLGAIFALLTAADRPDLPIASLTSVGAPIDVTQVPLVAPIRPFLGLAGERAGLVTQAYRLMGGLPKPLVRRAFQLSSFNKLVTKPIAISAKLDDADFLAQVEAVDRFTANMIAYPGRTFGQLYHRLLKGNQLASGSVTMDDRTISLADITAPLLAFGGASDGIAPVQAVRPIVDLVTGVDDLRFEVVPGRPPRDADRPGGALDHLADHRRVDHRPLLGGGREAHARCPQEGGVGEADRRRHEEEVGHSPRVQVGDRGEPEPPLRLGR